MAAELYILLHTTSFSIHSNCRPNCLLSQQPPPQFPLNLSLMAMNVPDKKVDVQEKRTLILKSSDNEEIIISEPAAFLSKKIKKIVEDDPTLSVINVPLANGQTLSKAVTYLNKHVEAGTSVVLDEEFSGEKIEDLLDLSKAFYDLDVKGLLDIVCKKIADNMIGKSVEWIREKFRLENDFTPEEEEEIRQEFPWD